MVLRGATGPPARSIGNAVWALFLVSHMTGSPLCVQACVYSSIVLSHFLRLMADLGPSESLLVKEQGLEYAEFRFVQGNKETLGVLKAVAEWVQILGMLVGHEIE
ncbi:hypothetical protein BS47DRAFT_1363477 [Hydnum rufescens UP504]|uniref:Uncharacterized protein n=1 Tax=Hydnum rufescens UP504 TaxID=1448309 RepID=A0A9P6AU10_9AGAM|nr:hypothetical protein BS47DRAFT_1363477 [Hydnum rufescens UP504]